MQGAIELDARLLCTVASCAEQAHTTRRILRYVKVTREGAMATDSYIAAACLWPEPVPSVPEEGVLVQADAIPRKPTSASVTLETVDGSPGVYVVDRSRVSRSPFSPGAYPDVLKLFADVLQGEASAIERIGLGSRVVEKLLRALDAGGYAYYSMEFFGKGKPVFAEPQFCEDDEIMFLLMPTFGGWANESREGR